MYVIIVGLGGIGRALTALAAEHGDNVVIVDQDEERWTSCSRSTT
jgi:trk system potassium uptake protein TrkA